jgi:hypothetical protein
MLGMHRFGARHYGFFIQLAQDRLQPVAETAPRSKAGTHLTVLQGVFKGARAVASRISTRRLRLEPLGMTAAKVIEAFLKYASDTDIQLVRQRPRSESL